jgi:large repetitive protein
MMGWRRALLLGGLTVGATVVPFTTEQSAGARQASAGTSTIIVKEVTKPSPDPSDTSFSFTAGGGLSPSGFSLKNGEQQTFSDIAPGSGYSVAETVPSGWVLHSATCSNGSPVSNITVGPGRTVTCTFKDWQRGTLVIKEVTTPSPDPSDTSFSFTAGGGLSPSGFSLTNGEQETFSDIVPGRGYSVAETVPSGWVLHGATCSNGSPVSNIRVGPGRTVTCTFRDWQRGTIIVTEVTNPSPDPSDTSFSFTAGGGLSPSGFSLKNGEQQTFSDVAPGSGYSVAETVPSGWDLTRSFCSNGSLVSNITVSPGKTVTCTFKDRQRGTLIIKEVTNPSPDPSDTSFSFTAGGGLSPSGFSLTNGQQQTFSDVVPGSGYSVAETVPSGWQLTSSTCDDGSPITNIDISAAETVTCTFMDTANSAPTDIQLSNSSIAENQPSGTDVGTLTTSDPDVGDTHTYSLANGGCGGGPFPDNSSFQIGGANSDTLQSAASFNYEVQNSYTICVRSTDSGSLFFDKQFTISVTNVNEPPTDISLDNQNIDENQPSGSLVGNLSEIGDPDSGESYTFTLLTSGCSDTFNDSASFQISGSQLQSAVSFDYEVKNSYSICVRVNDPGSPSLSFDKTFTISISDVNDAPVATSDSYSGAIGNTVAVVQTTATGPHVTLTGNSLIANDTDEDNPSGTFAHALSAVPETVSSTGGGAVQINSDGSFVYVTGVGDKNQDDTFTYHVTDGSLTTAGTATIHIDDFLVWYVDNSSAAATHDGRSTSPFLGLSSLDGAGGSGDSDSASDYIFLYYGTGASYGGGIPLEANQSLWGEKQGLTVNGHNLVAAGSNAPTITNASGLGVGLANGVDVQGLNISGTSGDAVNGSAVTTATVGTSTAVNISSAGGDGVDLSGAASGNISIAAPITGSAGHSVTVSGRSGGTVAFSGSINDSGTGISLTGNTGATITLSGGVTASTGTNTAFSASGGGTVTVMGSSNTLTTTTGTALNVQNTTIGASGLTFNSISASGAASGIVLNSTGTSGGLTVTGGASPSAGTGGNIVNSTGSSVVLTSTQSPSLSWMNITDSAGGASDEGIKATNITGTFALDHIAITNAPHNGIWLDNTNTNLIAFNLSNSTIQCNPGNACEPAGSVGNDGILLRTFGNSVLGSGSIANSTFSGVRATGVQIFAEDSSRIGSSSSGAIVAPPVSNSFTISGSTVSNDGTGIDMSQAQVANMAFQVLNNAIAGSHSHAINVFTAAGSDTGPTDHAQVGKIDGNSIGTAGVKDSGSAIGNGIRVVIQGQNTLGSILISNNTVREVANAGNGIISLFGQDGVPSTITSGSARFKVINNTLPANNGTNLNLGCGGPCTDDGIFALADQSMPVCAVMTGNNIYDVTTGPGGIADVYLAERAGPATGAQLNVEGTGGSNSTYLQANNTLAGASKFIDEGSNTSQVAPGACGTFPS